MIKPRDAILAISRTATAESNRLGCLRLERNELVPALDASAFDDILSSLSPDTFTAYPAVEPVRDALAGFLRISPQRILVGAGSDWLIKACFEVFCSPGDRVVLPVPTYGMYEVYSRLSSAKLVRVEHDDDFTLPMDRLLAALDTGPRILGLANPNGALGSYLAPAELEAVLDAAERNNTLVILDEAYVEYAPVDRTTVFSDHPNVVSVRTFSKAGGLAGLRIGYAIGDPEVIGWLAQVRPNVEVNQVGVVAACYLLSHPDVVTHHVRATLDGKARLAAWLSEAGFPTYRGHANFIQVRLGRHREPVLEALRRARVLVKDQRHGGVLDPWTRVTVGPPEQMDRVIEIIEDVLSRE